MVDIGIEISPPQPLENIFDSNTNYEIPHFQREYSWKKDHWTDFFDDVIYACENEKGHFFGFMTFKKSKGDVIPIIEGQQRLTTVTILISVIRDIFYEMKDDYYLELDQYINRRDKLSPQTPPSPKIILSDLNKEFFKKYIQETNTAKHKFDLLKKDKKPNLSNKSIIECYNYFYSELKKKISTKTENEKKDLLIQIVKGVLRYFIVLTTQVSDNLTAYNVFQTLNDRGLDLTITDLLKVYLFGLAGESWPNAKNKWDEIRETLSQINTNSFLRHYWLSKERIVKEKQLLSEIESRVKDKNHVFRFLDDLKDEAYTYEAILYPREDYWGQRSKKIVELLSELQNISIQQPLPLLMASSIKFPTNEFIKTIEYCVNFIFRYLTIMEKENKVLEKLFSDISIEIRNGAIINSQGVREKLIKEYITDETFHLGFSEKEIKTIKVATYILKKIEDSLDPLKEKISTKITLEHILPRNPNQAWIAYLKRNNMEKEDWVYRIGNLTLLLGKVNKKALNDFFEIKRDQYYTKMTNLKINTNLKDIIDWTSIEIIERQKWLADQAVKVWKI